MGALSSRDLPHSCAAPDLYSYSVKTVEWTAKIELKGEASKKTFRMERLYPKPKMR